MKRLKIIKILALLIITLNCSAENKTIGYFSEEFLSCENDLSKNDTLIFPGWQDDEIRSTFNAVSFYYKSTQTFLWFGKEKRIIDFGYLVAEEEGKRYILGKFTPKAIYNAKGNTVAEISNSSSVYDKIVGLYEQNITYMTGVWFCAFDDDGKIRPSESYVYLKIDIQNKSIMAYDPFE